MSWKAHDPSMSKTAKLGNMRDFAKLNKLVIRDGATEAKVSGSRSGHFFEFITDQLGCSSYAG